MFRCGQPGRPAPAPEALRALDSDRLFPADAAHRAAFERFDASLGSGIATMMGMATLLHRAGLGDALSGVVLADLVAAVLFASGFRTGRKVGVTAVISKATTPVWLFLALRFVDPTQVVERARTQGAR